MVKVISTLTTAHLHSLPIYFHCVWRFVVPRVRTTSVLIKIVWNWRVC